MNTKPESQTERVQRSVEITSAMWRRLPMLLPRGVVLEITGLDSRELTREVSAGRIRFFKQTPDSKCKYFKADIGKLLKLEI